MLPEAGEGPALGTGSDEALDLLSLRHNCFHFEATVQSRVGHLRSNIKCFYKVVVERKAEILFIVEHAQRLGLEDCNAPNRNPNP